MKKEVYKIPHTFKLLGTSWRVRTEKNPKHSKDECLGMVKYKERLIILKGGEDVNVLFHELSHVLDYLTVIGRQTCSSEIFAEINSLFWSQVFAQLPKAKPKRRKK